MRLLSRIENSSVLILSNHSGKLAMYRSAEARLVRGVYDHPTRNFATLGLLLHFLMEVTWIISAMFSLSPERSDCNIILSLFVRMFGVQSLRIFFSRYRPWTTFFPFPSDSERKQFLQSL